MINKPSVPARSYARDVPSDAVAICEFLLFALQQPYQSRADIAQPDDPEVIGVNVDVSRAQNFSDASILTASIYGKKNGVIPQCRMTPCSIETTNFLLSYLPPKVKFTPAKYLKLFWLPV